MENNRHWTPRQRIEERRLWRYWLRWFIKYHARLNPQRICALVTEYMVWANFLAVRGHLNLIGQLLKALSLISKFCNGLIGVSLTDSLPAPAID